ncbi:MAG: T9SS type A sorting domain-containing protein, partial [Bacteroidota bacterium]
QHGCDSIVIIERYFGFPPPPQLNIKRDQRICRGDTIFLTSDSYDSNLQWLKDGDEISGATGNSLYITEDGGYAISHFNDEGCVVVSDVVEIMIMDTPPKPIFSNSDNFLHLEVETDSQMVSYQWYLNGEILEDAISGNHCAKESGTYTLIATNDVTGCSSSFTTDIVHDPDVEACLVGVDDIVKRVHFKVYPNPHVDQFTVTYDLERAATVEIKIFDALGKVHYSQREKAIGVKFDHTIATKGWVKGVYLLQINVDGVNYIHKIIKGK